MSDIVERCGNGRHTSDCTISLGECGVRSCFKPEQLPIEGLAQRLRESWGDPHNASSDSPYLKMDCVAAASEIERLRAMNAELVALHADAPSNTVN